MEGKGAKGKKRDEKEGKGGEEINQSINYVRSFSRGGFNPVFQSPGSSEKPDCFLHVLTPQNCGCDVLGLRK